MTTEYLIHESILIYMDKWGERKAVFLTGKCQKNDGVRKSSMVLELVGESDEDRLRKQSPSISLQLVKTRVKLPSEEEAGGLHFDS